MENFIVSARKYRPANFESVVGQQHITITLQNAIARKQLAHAYLFCGPRGVGKTTCARIVAKTINCLNPTQNFEACDRCESCRAFNQGSSFNIHELDAASNTSVENIRSLNDQVRIPPQIGRYSVYIIDEVHMLSTAAFNAFLKTLEEPPAHVIFILATTEKHKILPTILSRCQIYDFRRIKIEDTVGYLRKIAATESVTSDDESLHLIAQKADGCMRDALSMFDKVVSFCNNNLEYKPVSQALNILDYDTYFDFCEQAYRGDYTSMLVTFDEVLTKGFEAQTFLGGLSSHLRDILVAKTEKTEQLLEVTGSIALRYKQQAQSLDTAFIFKALDLLSQTESSIKFSLNQRLHCELAILKLSALNTPTTTAPAAAPVLPSKPKETAPGQPTKQASEHTEAAVAKPVAQTPPAAIPQPEPQAPQPQPEIAVTPTPEPTPEIPQSANTPKQTTTEAPVAEQPSAFGISSIKNLRKGHFFQTLKEEPAEKKEEEILQETKQIDESDQESVLTAVKTYAETIAETRPRISIALNDAEITDGIIRLKVQSSILEEELIRQKHEILQQVKDLCGISGLDYTVEVDSTLPESKKIYVKSEDKLQLLKQQNKETITLIQELDLHIV